MSEPAKRRWFRYPAMRRIRLTEVVAFAVLVYFVALIFSGQNLLIAATYVLVVGAIGFVVLSIKDRGWRFGLREMLVLMTLISILFGMMRLLPP